MKFKLLAKRRGMCLDVVEEQAELGLDLVERCFGEGLEGAKKGGSVFLICCFEAGVGGLYER